MSVPIGTVAATSTPLGPTPPWVRRPDTTSYSSVPNTSSVTMRNSDEASFAMLTPTESPMKAKSAASVNVRRIGTSSKPGDRRPNALRKSQALTVDPLPSRTSFAQMPS